MILDIAETRIRVSFILSSRTVTLKINADQKKKCIATKSRIYQLTKIADLPFTLRAEIDIKITLILDTCSSEPEVHTRLYQYGRCKPMFLQHYSIARK